MMSNGRDQFREFLSVFGDCYKSVDVRAVCGKKDGEWRSIYTHVELRPESQEQLPTMFSTRTSAVAAIRGTFPFSKLDTVLDGIEQGGLLLDGVDACYLPERNTDGERGIPFGRGSLLQRSRNTSSLWSRMWISGRGAQITDCGDNDSIYQQLTDFDRPYSNLSDLLSDFTGYARDGYLSHSLVDVYAPLMVRIDDLQLKDGEGHVLLIAAPGFFEQEIYLSVIDRHEGKRANRYRIPVRTDNWGKNSEGLYYIVCPIQLEGAPQVECWLTINGKNADSYRWPEPVSAEYDDAGEALDTVFSTPTSQSMAETRQSQIAVNDTPNHDSRRVFVVHGHDEDALGEVEAFLRGIGLTPVVLYKMANQGRTVIEKFEKHSDVEFAVVLLTPDDYAHGAKTPQEVEARARQNVILELGYFLAKLGRGNVCALKKGDVETPSDIHGIVWVGMDESGAWKQKLLREIQEAGLACREEGKD